MKKIFFFLIVIFSVIYVKADITSIRDYKIVQVKKGRLIVNKLEIPDKSLTPEVLSYYITGSYNVLDKNNKKIDNTGVITNGYKVSDKTSYTVVVLGDVNSDGVISSADYILIKKHVMKNRLVSDDLEKIAADVSGDGVISSADYILIKKRLLKPLESVSVTGVSINEQNKTVDAGKTLQLTAKVVPNNARNKSVKWSSSDTSIADINSNGLITAKRNGTVTITATTVDGNKKASTTVKVVNGNIHLFGWSQSEADKKFGPILDGIFTGKTKEVVKERGLGGKFYMHFIDIAYVNDKMYTFYNGGGCPGVCGLGLAISEDGVNFDNKGCVVQSSMPYDMSAVYFSGVWYENGTFYIVYESSGDPNSEYGDRANIALATSNDGYHWTKQGVILYKDTKKSWYYANVGTPDLYKVGNTWYLTFHGFDFVDCQIGIAYGTDLMHLTMKDTPIIPTVDGTLHSGTTGRRDIIYIGGWYYMVYEVSTDSPFDTARWTHQFARSRDMINWVSVDPLIIQKDSAGNPINGFGYDGPCWVIVGDHIYVYFREGANATTRAELVLK